MCRFAVAVFEQPAVPVIVNVESPRDVPPVCTVKVVLLPKASVAGNPAVVASDGKPKMPSEALAGAPAEPAASVALTV
jgi:hypothetical protein